MAFYKGDKEISMLEALIDFLDRSLLWATATAAAFWVHLFLMHG